MDSGLLNTRAWVGMGGMEVCRVRGFVTLVFRLTWLQSDQQFNNLFHNQNKIFRENSHFKLSAGSSGEYAIYLLSYLNIEKLNIYQQTAIHKM